MGISNINNDTTFPPPFKGRAIAYGNFIQRTAVSVQDYFPSPAVRKSERGLSPRRGKMLHFLPLFFSPLLFSPLLFSPLLFSPLLGERPRERSELRVRGNNARIFRPYAIALVDIGVYLWGLGVPNHPIPSPPKLS